VILRHIYISAHHNFFGHHGQPAGTSPTIEVAAAELVAGKGIVGDRFFDWKENYAGQVTLFSLETHDALCAHLGIWDREPSVYRRNLIVEGADLNALIGREFQLQGVRMAGVSEAKPCEWMDQAFGPGARAALEGSGGLRARVLTTGVLRSQPAGPRRPQDRSDGARPPIRG
jgi:MOSC domain-containing protein YiiM